MLRRDYAAVIPPCRKKSTASSPADPSGPPSLFTPRRPELWDGRAGERIAADLEAAGCGALLWRGQALDGRQLVAAADAVVSAGGSMNREAAVLSTPAWSIYAGKLAAVDRALVAAGSLHLLHDVDDLARIPLRKKAAAPPPRISDALVVQFVDRLLEVARR